MNTKATTDWHHHRHDDDEQGTGIETFRHHPAARSSYGRSGRRTRANTDRNLAMPMSSVVMQLSKSCWLSISWRGHQPVADAAHGLHQQRIGGIALDLAPQPVDLHVNGTLADRAAVAGEREPGHGLAGVAASTRSISRSRSVRWIASSPRLSCRARCGTGIPEADRSWRWRRRRAHPPQDAGNAQRQFARLERLADIVVGADLKPWMRASAHRAR